MTLYMLLCFINVFIVYLNESIYLQKNIIRYRVASIINMNMCVCKWCYVVSLSVCSTLLLSNSTNSFYLFMTTKCRFTFSVCILAFVWECWIYSKILYIMQQQDYSNSNIIKLKITRREEYCASCRYIIMCKLDILSTRL